MTVNVKSALIRMTKPRTISIPARRVNKEVRDRKQTRRKRWRSMKLKRRARKKDSRQLQLVDFELDNRASVPRRAFGRTVFCPVARTSKWNPVRGTKPRILVDKLSLEERNIYIRVRAHIHHPPPTFGMLLSRDPYHRFFSTADRELDQLLRNWVKVSVCPFY